RAPRAGERRGGAAVGAQLEPRHDALLPDVADVPEGRDLVRQATTQPRDLRLEGGERSLDGEHLQAGQRDGAGEGVAGVRVAVEEGTELLVRCEERREDLPRRERRRPG